MILHTFHVALNLNTYLNLFNKCKRDAFLALKNGHKRKYSEDFDEANEWKHDYETALDVFNLFFEDEIKNFIAVHKSIRRHNERFALFMLSDHFEQIVNYCKRKGE